MQQPDKWEFVGLFDVSEANRISEPRSGVIRYLAGACSEPAIAGERNLRSRYKMNGTPLKTAVTE